MRSIIEGAIGTLILGGLFTLVGIAAVMPDDGLRASGHHAATEARDADVARIRRCAGDVLRSVDAPSAEQIDAAYRDCE